MAERIRVMIWGKTYPELSSKYTETVCTGGCREDGSPIRLYPMPFRYMDKDEQYSVYDWVEIDVERKPDFFRGEFKGLDYPENDVKLEFRCAGDCRCRGVDASPHSMKILDWGLLELARRHGWEAAKTKVEEVSNLKTNDFRLYMGNYRNHLTTFGIVGLWYPKIAAQTSLF